MKNRYAKGSLLFAVLSLAFLVLGFSAKSYAQTAVSGAISGVITDPTGAVVPGATVTVVDTKTQATLIVTSNESGRYTVPLLKPSTYKVSAKLNGLQSESSVVQVLLGASTNVDLKVTPTGSNQTVEVSATTLPLVDTETPALTTTFNEQQIQELPAPGGDITTLAFTAPGVVVNAGGAYGNFSSNGLPGVSNLFVLNGFDDEDPFLNLNNSGSSNLTLGQAEIAEATVVQNGYTVQYGRAAGAVINYTTRSGSNRFHGLANYYYNGDVLNANNWFLNNAGVPRTKAVSNEWAANVGGPIIKDKVFFFVDYEGLHYVLPFSGGAVFPSPQFQQYVLGNVPSQSQGLYQQAFSIYQAAPSYKNAQPVTTGSGPLQDSSGYLGCGPHVAGANIAAPGGGVFGQSVPCEIATATGTNNLNKEWLLTGRVDWNITDKHKLFGRYKMDHGSQPTSTNFAAPVFNVVSKQPEYEGQLNDTYVFSPHLTNQFVFAANWYTAYFGPDSLSATLAAFPTNFQIGDGGTNAYGSISSIGLPLGFPQGRNVTQYQFADDLTWIKANHTFGFGYNFRRDDVSDYDAQVYTDGGFYAFGSLLDFANGVLPGNGISSFNQAFTITPTAHLALYNVGMYAQDAWQVTPNLKLNLGVRVDRTGNPLCNESCFVRYVPSFPQSGVSPSSPYNLANGGAIGNHYDHFFQSVEKAVIQPRAGFTWDVFGSGKTVLRGGIGLFADLYPSYLTDGGIQNFPNYYFSSVLSGNVAGSGTNSGTANAAAAYQAVATGFAQGQSLAQISNTLQNAGVPFSSPNFNVITPSRFVSPRFLEWNLQLQKQVSETNAIIIGYSGNYGHDLLYSNPKINESLAIWDQGSASYVPTANCADANGNAVPCYPNGFADVPSLSPDQRFAQMGSLTNSGLSNYNGVSVTLKHIDHHGLSGQITYTYSHALDDISNGGTGLPFNGTSIGAALAPGLPSQLNYGNSDYDVRNNLVLDGIWDMPFKFNHFLVNEVLGGWSLGAKSYYRSGEPFSVTSGFGADFGPSTGGAFLAQSVVAPSQLKRSCSTNPQKLVTNGCLDYTQYASDQYTAELYGLPANYPIQNTFGNIKRNAFYGPHYADTDISVYKKVVHKEAFTVQLGANSFNVFNHPNFGQPSGGFSPTGSMGRITGTISPPTSPYGSFQGSAVSGRVLQVLGKITF